MSALAGSAVVLAGSAALCSLVGISQEFSAPAVAPDVLLGIDPGQRCITPPGAGNARAFYQLAVAASKNEVTP